MSAHLPCQKLIMKFLTSLHPCQFHFLKEYFGQMNSLQDMFNILWDLEVAHHTMQINLVMKNKNDEMAEQFRKEGNFYYQEEKYIKALEFYNKSIIFSSSQNLDTPSSISSAQDLPTATTAQDLPTSITAQDLPTSITAQDLPTSTTAQDLPTSTTAQDLPTSTTAQDLPTSTTAKDLPTSVTAQDLPTSMTAQDLPTSMTAQDLPTSNEPSKNLAHSYANRSALLFDLGKYNECLTDISRALQHGYPAILKPKLVERQAKCYLALNDRKNAKKNLNECILSLRKLGLEERNMAQTKGNLEALLKQCKSPEEKRVKKPINEVHEKYKYLFSAELPDCPLLGDPNPKIPSLSKAVDLEHEPERGRFLIAIRDIMPGEVLITENGFCTVVLPKHLLTHCSNCFRKTNTPVPCPNCVSVVFCCEDCRVNATNEFHNTECMLLPTLLALVLGRNSFLAFRCVVQLTLPKLKEKISQYLNEEKSEESAGFNDQNMYCSDDYRTIHYLNTREKVKPPEDLIDSCSVAFCLVKLLLKTNYFNIDENPALTDDICLVGRVLFAHMLGFQSKSRTIGEFAVNPIVRDRSFEEVVGFGIFSVFGHARHSCCPTLDRFSYGRTVVVRAIQFIPKGSECNYSYGKHYAYQSTDWRRGLIKEELGFYCTCIACVKYWPRPNTTPDKCCLKCPECNRAIPTDIKIERCKTCFSPTADFSFNFDGTSISFISLASKLNRSIKKCNRTYENVWKGDYAVQGEENIIKAIFLLNKYAHLPNNIIFEAQEALKHCFRVKGMHYYLQ